MREEAKVARWALVYSELKRQIQNLELVPGARLSESSIAAQFGVSASPVRDALGRLSQEGLLTVRRGQGYTVASLTIGGITETCDLRYVLETGAAELAMERARPEDVEALRPLAAATGEPGVAGVDLIRRNAEFHTAVAGLTGNGRIVESVKRVMEDSVRVFHLGLPTFEDHGMQADHDALLDAIAAKNVDAMREIVHREAYEASRHILESLVRNPGTKASQLIASL
ncbi:MULTISPECIES: GntR family transcriptional regulator [unclassified Streptomyces]|uniref:GntR family transcriptional regulator n=1 Tax=unclassified Streptomyces TaxID=2593676 RepID=UPI0036E0760E